MPKKKDLFLIIDANALLHRAWHAIPPLTTADGRVVNAAYGFITTVEKMREKFSPKYMAAVWDLPGGTFRHEAYKDYKGTREKKEPELYEQIDLIKELLGHYRIPCLSKPGFEADDIIGTLAKQYGPKDPNVKVVILTGDLDALQLVDEDIEVLTFLKGLSQTKTYDIAAVKERYGLLPSQLIDMKALMGDSSDNIPGLAGIGKKTAETLLAEHGSIEKIYKAIEADNVPEKFAKKFRGQERRVEEMRHLVTIVKNVDIDFALEHARVQEPDADALRTAFRELEFRSLLARYEGGESGVDYVEDAKLQKKMTFVPLETLSDAGDVFVLLQTQDETLFGSVLHLILSDGRRTAKVDASSTKTVVRLLDRAKRIVTHDAKRLMHALQPFETPLFDVKIAAYLLSSASRNFDFDTLTNEYLGKAVNMDDDAAIGALQELARHLERTLEEEGMKQLSETIEMPLAHVLVEMESTGILLDKNMLGIMSEQLGTHIDVLAGDIHQLAGHEFNIASPSQLADILFDTLGLPTTRIKRTKTSYSTAASELEKLWESHPIIPKISEYRELTKLKSTYVDVLPTLVDEDSRIHTTFDQTVAATGRLSSNNPNLQNIPIRTELGREIRKAFVAKSGYKLIAADFSQIELRLASILSKDQAFLQAFKDGADIHTRTAAEVLGLKEDEVTTDQRRAAKAINFGILYGMGAHSLAKSTGFTIKEAKAFIERYFDIHHGLKAYIDKMKAKVHEDGYVETLFGRKRYLPEAASNVPMLRAAAERMAVNMPMQGTQADLIKMAMIELAEWLKHADVDAVMLLQVHDELVLEVKDDDIGRAAEKIEEVMRGIHTFEIPLAVTVKIGQNWGDMNPV
ncbi:MAG: DNA polymerase I [bacterium]|nr:DNA polymerase I [bacterium]MDA1024432.1 DNA polymerase I [bacterium]